MGGVCVLLCVCVCACACACVCAEHVTQVEVCVCVQQDAGSVLQGQALHPNPAEPAHLHGDLRLIGDGDDVGDEDEQKKKKKEVWFGLVSVQLEEKNRVKQSESFTSEVVNKMKRALVLGASALIILVLNHNTVREMDLSEVLSKPVIIIQTSENVTKLISALLRGLHATARITYKTFLQNNLGATLTLWSSCGRSRGGVYGEWQGVICTGETNSPVQMYLQQLWESVVLLVLLLCSVVLLQTRWQQQEEQLTDDLQLHLKQDLLTRLSALQTRTYTHTHLHTHTQQETDNCAVCLEQYHNNQCLRVLPCLHEFHRDCVDPWLLLQQTCPLCKRSVFSNFC